MLEKNQKGCKRCGSHDFKTDDQGLVHCQNCFLVQEAIQFDHNVVFGSQKQMLGKNVDMKDKFNQQSSQKRSARIKKKIGELTLQLDIDPMYNEAIEAANRLMKYADNCKFFSKGKNLDLYSASALYIALRYKAAPYLLIDFSDKMNVSLFTLARCYFKLSKSFGFQKELPLIDPSLFILRYCKKLDLGEKTKAVSETALRLIKRMKRDWMCQGRRPSSLCGAAILIATKIHKVNNPHCSTTDICKTVFVCDETIRRRLDQFKQTKVSKLTPDEFQNQDIVDDQEEMDPPAFRKARIKSQMQAKRLEQMKLKVNKEKWKDPDEVPQEIIRQYSQQIAQNYEQARGNEHEVFHEEEENNLLEEIEENESHNTGGMRNVDSQELQQSENSDIDERLVFLDEKQQQERKKIWENQNKAWLDKQTQKAKRGENENKKKRKSKKNVPETTNPFEAVKNTQLGSKIDQEELKKLFSTSPNIKKKSQEFSEKSLRQIFNPFQKSGP